jgi:hypothetical protein
VGQISARRRVGIVRTFAFNCIFSALVTSAAPSSSGWNRKYFALGRCWGNEARKTRSSISSAAEGFRLADVAH